LLRRLPSSHSSPVSISPSKLQWLQCTGSMAVW
jgi:hypothetical protein